MAYIVKFPWNNGEWDGPFPNKIGEFCGNRNVYEKNFRNFRGINQKTCENFDAKHFRIGRPSSCPAGTSEQMSTQRYVGLYLIADSSMDKYFGEEYKEVDTDVLCEEVVSGQRESHIPFQPNVPMKDKK